MGGNELATVYDIMVYYRQSTLHTSTQQPPPVCPKCGSHRTQVVGRSNDAKTVVVRCSSCGERSSVAVGETPEAGQAVETVQG
jgi:transcription elongation factor Elf1